MSAAVLGTALGNATTSTALLRNGSGTGNDSLTLASSQGDNATGMYDWQRTNDTDVEPENIGQAVLLFYIILIVMIGAQSALLWWKKKHKRSYEGVTLLGLWLFPAVIAFHLAFYRFCVVWAAYSGTVAYFLSLCINKRQVAKATPRQVYTFFLASHKGSVALGVLGYVLVVAEVFGLAPLLRLLRVPPEASILLLWYGLYFGVLGRDFAELASDRMAAVIGTSRQLSVSVHNCGICGGELADARSHLSGESTAGNASVQLQCKHLFHPLCIRGWTMVGKKSVCPVCLEKVDLRHLYADRAWNTQNLSWIQMLDALRYMLVWNPLLLVGVHFVLKELGIKPHPHQHPHQHFNTTLNSTVLRNLTAVGVRNATFSAGHLT